MTRTELIAHVRSLAAADGLTRALLDVPGVTEVVLSGFEDLKIRLEVRDEGDTPLVERMTHAATVPWKFEAMGNRIEMWVE